MNSSEKVTAKANAAFIVQCVNERASLLSQRDRLAVALERFERLPLDDDGSRTIPPGFLDEARALLQEIAGEKAGEG